MKKIFLLFCLLWVAFAESGRAQEFIVSEAEPAQRPDLYRNSVFLELAGNAGFLSLNYERLFPKLISGKVLALRTGFFLVPELNRQDRAYVGVYLPVEGSVLLGKKAVKLELGAGATYFYYYSTSINMFGDRVRNSYMELVPVVRVGGRWQKPGKHWFVKVAFTPLLKSYYTVINYPFSPWAGIGVGYNFGTE